ncbi:hypothetical protein ACNS7O_17005 (plasmid) [Haloferacaceae archaeon DSL9]
MTDAPWVRQSLRIGTMEFRRTVRAVRADRGKLALLGGGALFATLMMTVVAFVAISVFVSPDELISLPSAAGSAFVFPWVLGAYMFGSRALTQRGRIDAEAIMLTTASPKAIAGGLLVAEFLRAWAYVGLAVVVLGGAVAYALEAVVSVLVFPLGISLFIASALAVGYPAGVAGSLLVARSPFVAKYKSYIGGAFVLVAVGGFYGFGTLDLGALGWLPMAWFADLLVVGSMVEGDPLRAGGALASSLALIAAGIGATLTVTARLWFADPLPIDGDEDAASPRNPSTARSFGGGSALSGLLSPKSEAVARKTLLLTRRNPSRLSFLLVPLIFVSTVVSNAVQTGTYPIVFPVLFAVGVPWLAGLVFGANPFGDEGRVLPMTLLSSVTGREFVRGYAALGIGVGLPATLLSTLGSGAISPYTPAELGGLVALGIAVLCGSVPLTITFGMRLPRTKPISVSNGKAVIPPSITAVVLHAIVVLGLGFVGAVSLLYPELGVQILGTVLFLAFVLPLSILDAGGVPLVGSISAGAGRGLEAISNVPIETIHVVGYYGSTGLLLALGVVAVVAARRRFEAHTLA